MDKIVSGRDNRFKDWLFPVGEKGEHTI